MMTDLANTPQETLSTTEQPPQENVVPPKIQIKLHILQYIKQKQNENGLKHMDFESYRRYCTKRLRKLRSVLDMKHKKETKFTQVVKKKKKGARASQQPVVDQTPSATSEASNTTTATETSEGVQGIKNSSLYSQKKVTERIVQIYNERKEVEIKKLREQATRNLIRENVEKQIHEQKELLLNTFVKKNKKEVSKKNMHYDQEFLTELYTHITPNPTITEEEIEARVQMLNNTGTQQDSTEGTVVKGDDRFLQLLLVQAERAWSHSRHLKNEMKQFTDNTRIKFHQLNRLKKAVKWADLLVTYCNIFSEDQRTILESVAYRSYLVGLLQLEKENWVEAYKSFKSSQTVYDQLYKALTSIPQQVREEYKKQVNEIAVNYLRVCEYNLKKLEGGEELLQKLESSQQVDNIQVKLSQVNEDLKSVPQQSVEWEGVMTIAIPNEKIRTHLANARSLTDAEYKTTESKLRAFDKLFGIYNDVTRMIKEETKNLSTISVQKKQTQQSNISGMSQSEQLNQLRFLHSYVSYVIGTKTIERNIIMLQSLLERMDTIQQQVQKERVEKKQKANPVDIIRLFDGLIQNVADLADMLQSININPDSAKKLQTDLDEKKSVFTAYRCYYLAHVFASQHKWAECFVLLERAEKLVGGINSSQTYSLPNPKDILTEIRRAKVTTKSQQVLSKKTSTSILSAYDSDDEQEKTKKQQELVERITQVPATTRANEFITPSKPVLDNLSSYKLVDMPPSYQLIPGKPVFFDIANSLVCEYPVEYIDEQIKELSKTEKPKETATEETKKKGWFGLW